MEIDLNGKIIKIGRFEIIAAFIVVFFILFSASDLAYNTAFVDEAIYATVGEGALRNLYWERGLSWMSGSYIYPIISAVINRQFGLAGIRLFSTFCVTATGLISGYLGYKLGKMKAAIWTMLFFFTTGITLDLAQIGTYDAPAFLFFALSLLFAISLQHKKGYKRWLLLIASSIFFSLAVLTKYIFVIMTPAIGLFFIIYTFKRHWLLKFVDGAVWGLLAASIVVGFVVLNLESLIDFFNSGAFSEPKTRIFILTELTRMIWVQAAGAFFGIITFFSLPKKRRGFAMLLLLGGIIPLSYHLLSANFRSSWKHMVFTSFFWSPFAGLAMQRVTNFYTKKTKKSVYLENVSNAFFIILTVGLVSILWFNIQSHWRFQRSWPSASAVIEYLDPIHKYDNKILAEGGSVYKYHLFTGFEDPAAWVSTWYSDYNGLFGKEAYIAAIEDQYYDFIILNYYFTIDLSKELEPYIEEHYDLVLEDTYKISGAYDNVTRVWAPKDRSND